MNEVIKKYLKKIRSPKVLVLIGIAGIILIALSSFSGKESPEKKSEQQTEISAEEYCQQIENDICNMVSSITGSKNVTAVVTLESGIRYSYADTKEEVSSDKTEKETQISDTELKEGFVTVKTADGGEQALLVTTQMPEIRGVAIVCEGGDNEIIKEKIQNTVKAALNITSKRVYICGRKTE